MSADLPTDPAELQRCSWLSEPRMPSHGWKRDQAKVKLQALIKRYFGRSSEKLDPNQIAFAWAAVQADHAMAVAPAAPRPRASRVPFCQAGAADGGLAGDGDGDYRPAGGREGGPRRQASRQDPRGGHRGSRLPARPALPPRIIRPVYASAGHACAPRVAALPRV